MNSNINEYSKEKKDIIVRKEPYHSNMNIKFRNFNSILENIQENILKPFFIFLGKANKDNIKYILPNTANNSFKYLLGNISNL